MTAQRLPELQEWQLAWGSPGALFLEQEGRILEVAFLVALLLHLAPFGFLWHKKITKPQSETLTLQNVELIEPEPETPPAPPLEVQKPKSALEFLKMALPIFRKPAAAPELPREIPILPKVQEPKLKLAEPEKLIERKMPALSNVPQIQLDQKSALSPKAVEIARLPQSRAQSVEPFFREPALKLEEVGKRAVSLPAAPEIRLDRAASNKEVEIQALPKTSLAARAPQLQEKLVEKSYVPSSRKFPSVSSLPLGYEKRGVSLEAPREVSRAIPKVEIQKPIEETEKKDKPITISKKRAEISGPLSKRKVVKSALPAYPDWAKRQNIEAELTIRFTVSPNGDVVSMVIQRTSGYPELDKSSQRELKKWKFSQIDPKEGEQWGVITFRFLLE